MSAFEPAEYDERLAKTRAEMERRGIDVLLVTDHANLYYLTGYDAWSFYVPQAVIVPAGDEPPLWVGRGMDAPGAVITTAIPRHRILGYADDYVESATKQGGACKAGRKRQESDVHHPAEVAKRIFADEAPGGVKLRFQQVQAAQEEHESGSSNNGYSRRSRLQVGHRLGCNERLGNAHSGQAAFSHPFARFIVDL